MLKKCILHLVNRKYVQKSIWNKIQNAFFEKVFKCKIEIGILHFVFAF